MKQIELVVHVPDDVRFMNATRGHAPREKDEYHNASKELLHVFPSVEQGTIPDSLDGSKPPRGGYGNITVFCFIVKYLPVFY